MARTHMIIVPGQAPRFEEIPDVPPTAEEIAEQQRRIIRSLSDAVQARLDSVAADRGYGDDRTAPSVSARSYAGYPNQFQAECIVYGQWCAACWTYCYGVLAAVQDGERGIPTAEELVAELPPMVWP